MDEQLIISGCKRAESWARKIVYDQYAPVMFSVCLRYAGDRETAKDLMQDGFLKVFTKVNSYSGTGSFEGWIRRIFVTTALEYLRSKDIVRNSIHYDDCAELEDSANISALDRLSADDLMRCISELPDGYRTIFNLFAIEGYSHQEIAQLLGIKEVTSRTQFIRARNSLQKKVIVLLEKENGRR